MSVRLCLHAISLVAVDFLAYHAASDWSTWTHDRHPSAAPIPVGCVLAVAGYLFWYHATNALDAGRWKLRDLKSWCIVYFAAMVVGAMSTAFFPALMSDQPLSRGRLAAFLVFQALTNGLVLALGFPQREFNSAGLVRRWLCFAWFRRLLAGLSACIVCLLVVAFVEAVFFGLNLTRPTGPAKVYEGEYLGHGFSAWDDQLGNKLAPSTDVLCRLKVDDTTVWDVHYSTDEFGRRTTINPNSDADRYAVFFGCSFLFGEGANDEQTIPSQFAAAAPQYHAYNYGVPGYGTQQMLAKLEENNIAQEILEKRGTVFYLYLEDVHEPRVIGDMQLTNSFAWNYPYYDFTGSGEIKRFGNFTTGRPILSKVYWLLGQSQFMKYANLNFPKPNEEHFRLTAAIIEKSSTLCREQLGCDKFYVVCFPHQSPHRRLLPYLAAAGIEYLDYAQLFNPCAGGFFHDGDGHPTPKANRLLAEAIVSNLQETQQPPNGPPE